MLTVLDYLLIYLVVGVVFLVLWWASVSLGEWRRAAREEASREWRAELSRMSDEEFKAFIRQADKWGGA